MSAAERELDHKKVINECIGILENSQKLALMIVLKTEIDEKGRYVKGFTIHENILENFGNKDLIINTLENVTKIISSGDYPSNVEIEITE
jgi:hypothetical protein